MITYSKYLDSKMRNWYDSSNIRYSECYDRPGDSVNLKVVFGDGRVYYYRDVAKEDYLAFTSADSNGKAFAKSIRPKYKGDRLADVNIADLDKLREELINEEQEIAETKTSDIMYKLLCDDKTGNFILTLNNKPIFRGKEHEVSIVKLFKSMNLNCQMELVDSSVLAESTTEQSNSIETTIQTITNEIPVSD